MQMQVKYAPEVPSALRQLGRTEHMFWLLGRNGAGHHLLAAEIEGQTTIEGWRAALGMMQQRHPLFAARIDASIPSAPSFRRVRGADIPLRVVPGGEAVRLESEMEKELATAFDTDRAPLVRAVLIHEPHKSAFILAMDHSIGDGFSAAYALRDLLLALSGEEISLLPLAPTQDEMLGFPPAPAPAANESGPDIEPKATAAFDPDKKAPAIPQVQRLRLTKELTNRLLERARDEQTTVHGALCAALVIAGKQLYPEWGDGPVRFFSSVSTRKLLGVQDDCGLFVSPCISDLPVEDFWSLARNAKRSIAPWQTLQAVTQVMGSTGEIAHLDANAVSQLAGGMYAGCRFTLTNLGALALPTVYGDLTLQSIWGPAVLAGHPGEQTVGVSTLNGSMCFTHSSHTPLPGLLQGAEKILIEASHA